MVIEALLFAVKASVVALAVIIALLIAGEITLFVLCRREEMAAQRNWAEWWDQQDGPEWPEADIDHSRKPHGHVPNLIRRDGD